MVNTAKRGEFGYNETTELTESLCPVGAKALVDEDDGQKEGNYDRLIGLVYCNDSATSVNQILLEEWKAKCMKTFAVSVNLVEKMGYQPWMLRYNTRVDVMDLLSQYLILLIFAVVLLLLSFDYTKVVISTWKSPHDIVVDSESEDIGIIKTIQFNNTILSSLTIDPISDLVYVSGMPDHSYNYSCSKENTNSSSGFKFLCSTIYILDWSTGQINNLIKLRPGEIIHDMTIDPHSGMIYAAGEYNYLENKTEPIQYEDDVLFVVNQTGYSNSTNDKLSQQSIHSNDIQRIRLYGEEEEGKEGDMSSIAVDTHTNKIYAGIRYFQGGREGVFIIDIDNKTTNGIYSKNITPIKLNASTDDDLTNPIMFVPLGETGPDQILVNDKTPVVYVSLKNDNFVALIDGLNNTVQEKIVLQKPQSMSISPSAGLLYVASGDSNWFNVINMKTNKVISTNTQIAYPMASAVNDMTNRVYVVDCHHCDNYDFTNGTTIYELNSTGSTVNSKTYEDVNFMENELVVNPFANKLYAIGTDQTEMANLYVIDLD